MGRMNALPTLSKAACITATGEPSNLVTLIRINILPRDCPYTLSKNIQYKKSTKPFRLKLKNGSQSGQPGTIVKVIGKPPSEVRKVTIETITPTNTTSTSHARNRSHQKAILNPEEAEHADAAIGVDVPRGSVATAVPHLGQNFASSANSFPQFLQYRILEILTNYVTNCPYNSFSVDKLAGVEPASETSN